MDRGPTPKINEDVIDLDPLPEKEDDSNIEEVDVTAMDLAEIINVDAKEEHLQVTKIETETHETETKTHRLPNQPDTITSQETTYDVVVKDVHN